jgi:signal transduction histidine kinase/phage shock protein PspC (stress-responsive transcriptional regulator)
MLGGVCAGLAEYLGRDPLLVRIVAAATVAAGGIGVLAYALAWTLMPVAPGSERTHRPRGDWIRAALLVAAVVGVIAGIRLAGLAIGDWPVWALVLGLLGLALLWRKGANTGPSASDPTRPTLMSLVRRSRLIDLPRALVGLVLVAAGVVALLHSFGVQHNLGRAVGSVLIIGIVLTLVVTPWFVRLGRSLAAERAARIREQERAELAAHLHDSVLQTLALIQRRAPDAREVATLARRQERELRQWLFERSDVRNGDSVQAALKRTAAEVEERHRIPIEAVVVGDRPLDAKMEALVHAAREAMTNAAKFAGEGRIDLYAELAVDRAEVFVRDRGPGFDQTAIPADRRGVRDSIVARMERQGGSAHVRSVAGEGTEVELRMPSSTARAAAVS